MRVSRGITQDAEFEELGRRGYIGNLNDRQYKLLGNMGLRGALTDRIGSSAISAYALAAVDNKLPPLVMDMKEEDYFSNNTIGSFSEVVEHSRAGNATMIDSDGLLKWAPHNLALNSASPATQSITVISGADYTVECTGVSIALSGAGTGTVTEGNPVTVTASTTTLTLTVTGSTGTMWAYRSDLGGMVNNPDRGDSYVPTTSSAVYLPRRGHHVYNGTSWVNEGLLHESEQRVNLIEYSEDFTNAYWTKGGDAATLAVDAVGPDGETSAVTLIDNNAGGTGTNLNLLRSVTVATSTAYTLSVFAKADGINWLNITIAFFTTPGTSRAYFDLENGVKGTIDAGFSASSIEAFGNGWYRCSVTFTTDVTDTSGQLYLAAASADNNVQVALDGTSSILIYGAQFEASSTPSSYIPTSGATVTRSAETLTIPYENLTWPDPEYISDELVTNGGFDTDVSGWTSTAPTTATWNAGQVDLARNSGSSVQNLYQNFSISIGSVYEVSIDVLAISNSVSLFSTGGGVPIGGSITTTGTHKRYFVGKSGDVGVYVGLGGSTTATATIDNVSVKEINPLALSIQMDGRMTYADEGSNAQIVFTNWEVGGNQISPRLRTDSTRTGAVQILQRASSVLDTVETASTTVYAPGINVPFNIASRHGSTFLNGAVDGVALTENTTPAGLPDLSTTDLELGHDFMGTIKTFRMWDVDIGDTGIEEVTS